MKDQIRYHASLSDEQIENLRAFTERGERSDPVTFAGRDDILQLIPRLIRNKRNDPSLKSITQVIQGAPGAGKSSLLNELDRTNRGDHVSVIRLEGEDLSESVRVTEQVLNSIGANASDIGTAGSRSHRTTGDIGIAQHQEGWETRKASALERITQGASIWQALKPMLEVEDDHVFLFLIDEAQRVSNSHGKDINEIVTSLHSGGEATAGLRILPVFAGLSSTSDRLRGVGLSRQAANPHHLGSLSLEEAQIATLGFMRNESAGLREAFAYHDRAELVQTFAVASEGWPRHLHNYLTGFARELVLDREREHPTGLIRLNNILEHGHEKRCDYYDERLQSAELGKVENALMALTQEKATDATIDSDDVEIYMAERYGSDPTTVQEKIVDAVHTGVLERRPDLGRRIYSYPIPSFSTYMRCDGQREQTLMNMRSALLERMASLEKEARESERGFER